MRYMKKFGLFQINEAKFSLSDELRDIISGIDLPISKQILAAESDDEGAEMGMLDIDHENGDIVVKKGKHKSATKIGRAINTILGSGNYNQKDLEDFSTLVYRKIATGKTDSVVPEVFAEYFPDNFSGALVRGVKMQKKEIYIDNPGGRTIWQGNSSDEKYLRFREMLSDILSENTDKSVHMLLSKGRGSQATVKYFGDFYLCIPEKGASFSYCSDFRNGGVGSLWFFADRVVKENMQHIELLKELLDTTSTKKAIDLISNMQYEKDELEFESVLEAYTNWLKEIGMVGDMTYDELVERCKTETRTLHLWTQSKVLHILV